MSPSTTSTPQSTAPAVRIHREGPALWLTLNRPEAFNGISPDIVAGLEAGLDQAEADDDIRVVVLAAEGRVFCAGADLKYVMAMTGQDTEQAESARRLHEEFTSAVGRTFNRIEALPKPVIAAVHGLAVAGGLELLLCTDLVIAAESARSGDAHANYGLIPGAGGSIRLPRRIGISLAKHLMFTGQNLSAQELAHTDLISQVVPDDQLSTVVTELAGIIATKSPLSLRVMKDLANTGTDIPLPEALERESAHLQKHTTSHDFTEGVRAFNEKRTPTFLGR